MADTKISALPAGNPVSTDLVPYVNVGGSTTQQAVASAVGCLILLAEASASGSTSLDFLTRNVGNYSGNLFQSDFDTYLIELVNLVPATNLVNVLLRCSTDGATFDSGTNYEWVGFRASKAGSAAAGATATTAIGLDASGTIVNTASVGGLIGRLEVYAPVNTTFQKRFIGQTAMNDGTSSPDIIAMLHGAYTVTGSAVVGIRVIMSSGNITSGTVRIYGIRK